MFSLSWNCCYSYCFKFHTWCCFRAARVRNIPMSILWSAEHLCNGFCFNGDGPWIYYALFFKWMCGYLFCGLRYKKKKTIVLFIFCVVVASSGISTGNSKIRICWSTGIFVCGTFLLLGFTVCIFWIPLVLVSLCRFSHDSGLCQTHMLTEFWSIVLKKIYIPITLSNLDEHMIYRIVFPWFVCWCELER